MVTAYFEYAVSGGAGGRRWWEILLRRKRPRRMFDHLIVHSDAEGFYVPVDFNEVVIAEDDVCEGGGMIGSSHALLRECEQLAVALGIPPDLAADSEDVYEACEAQGQGTGWRRYGMETFCCLRLREGARRSILSGAALHFT